MNIRRILIVFGILLVIAIAVVSVNGNKTATDLIVESGKWSYSCDSLGLQTYVWKSDLEIDNEKYTVTVEYEKTALKTGNQPALFLNLATVTTNRLYIVGGELRPEINHFQEFFNGHYLRFQASLKELSIDWKALLETVKQDAISRYMDKPNNCLHYQNPNTVTG